MQVPQAACGSDEPHPISHGILECNEAVMTQMQGWVTRVMQAALLDVIKLQALLSEAHQLQSSAVATQVTGCRIALGTSWIWDALDGLRQKRRANLLEP